MVFCAIKLRGECKREHRFTMSRQMNTFYPTEVLIDVSTISSETVVRPHDIVENTFYHFIDTLNLVIEKHAHL